MLSRSTNGEIDLWLSSYHTGAGLNDVVFSAGSPGTVGVVKGFFDETNNTSSYNLLFDLGNDFAWGLKMIPNAQFYTAWQPVELDAGVSGSGMDVSGFFMNRTGLQWNSTSFGGWLGESIQFFTSKAHRLRIRVVRRRDVRTWVVPEKHANLAT